MKASSRKSILRGYVGDVIEKERDVHTTDTFNYCYMTNLRLFVRLLYLAEFHMLDHPPLNY